MDGAGANQWFADYLEAFARCGRGDSDAASLLSCWDIPLLLATDDGVTAVTTEEQALAVAQQQIDRMRAADYAGSEILSSQVTVLNAMSALYRAEVSRRRTDGREINRLTATYLLTDRPLGRRISALLIHSP